jgi:hypothetical protein
MSTEDINEHSIEGVGGETVAKCPKTGEEYGPSGRNSISSCDWCPYCGESVNNSEHNVTEKDIFCENTNMANWRYCPNCGDKVEDNW